MAKKRNIGQELLDGVRAIQRGTVLVDCACMTDKSGVLGLLSVMQRLVERGLRSTGRRRAERPAER